jgi:phospholipid-binding lipoprotein MlaA
MKYSLHLLTLLVALMLSACATVQNNHDPIEPVNRVSDTINDSIDRISLKPAAQGYTAIVPKPMRLAVSNFYDNATYMNTVLNDFLQGKGGQGAQDFLRFLINSTLGIGGMVDVASSMGLERHQEDFGQTLATWGVSQGAYIVYPLLGPNSVRNTPDFLTATATDPLFWAGFALAPYVTIPVAVLKYIDKRAQLLEASDMRDELALDPYVFTREAWRQNRDYMIYDGHPPTPASNKDDGWEEDDFDSGDAFDSSENSDTSTPDTTPTNIATSKNKSAKPKTQLQPRIQISNTLPTDMTLAQRDSAQSNHASAKHQSPSINSSASITAKKAQYVIYLSSHYSEIEAAAEQGHISKLGVQTTIIPVTLNHHTWYRLRANEYSNKAEAVAQLDALRVTTRLNDAWLSMESR